METLQVENFLVLKEVEFSPNEFTIIIGPQASGKSLVIKLLYFFRKFMRDIYLESIGKGQVKRDVTKEGLFLFEQYFPRYAWGKLPFKIAYEIDEVVTVRVERGKSKQGRVRLDYSSKLAELHRRYKWEYKKYLAEHSESLHLKERRRHRGIMLGMDPWDEFKRANLDDFIKKYIISSAFVPASRSFFANLQKNVFSFLASNIEIDPFIKEFGRSYEHSKRLYRLIREFPFEEDISKSEEVNREKRQTREMLSRVTNLVREILRGEYVFEDEQDWIDNELYRVNVANASSGQQEALPMLLMLSTVPLFPHQRTAFLIEEPEAHLFPKSQQHIVDILSVLYRMGQQVILTTHTPYILAAINNLILAEDVIASSPKLKQQVMDKLGMAYPVKYEDVEAYIVQDGTINSIRNDKVRLVGTSLIDEVSNDFDTLFNDFLDLLPMNKESNNYGNE